MLYAQPEEVTALPTRGLVDYEHNGSVYTLVAVPDGWHVQCGVILVAHIRNEADGFCLIPFWGDTTVRIFQTLPEVLAGVSDCDY
ncbi:hypothetical protein [Lysinibacter cavernae]|uniref:Uncharacterized protein n=1 Tax=Lysinibacter cavernae TaxID=1640652 RepID=A0A7X5TS17_9MICO|nr:hypothetical protein [Lysinibacter cavernae]NIH52941.1 hypothetical protein [Lysinibacter cavernae]